MRANATLLQMKYGRVILCFAELAGITVREAVDFFYHSVERELIRDGVSDLHCMSDGYLAEDLLEEYRAETDVKCEKPVKDTCEGRNEKRGQRKDHE